MFSGSRFAHDDFPSLGSRIERLRIADRAVWDNSQNQELLGQTLGVSFPQALADIATIREIPRARPETPAETARRASVRNIQDFHDGVSSTLETPLHLVAISESNAATSRLLQLPLEIRNMIYKAYFEPKNHWNTSNTIQFMKSGNSRTEANGAYTNLLCVCRQVYVEAIKSPVQGFTYYFYESSLTDLSIWLDRICKVQREAISRIEVHAPELRIHKDRLEDALRSYEQMGRRQVPQLEWHFDQKLDEVVGSKKKEHTEQD